MSINLKCLQVWKCFGTTHIVKRFHTSLLFIQSLLAAIQSLLWRDILPDNSKHSTHNNTQSLLRLHRPQLFQSQQPGRISTLNLKCTPRVFSMLGSYNALFHLFICFLEVYIWSVNSSKYLSIIYLFFTYKCTVLLLLVLLVEMFLKNLEKKKNQVMSVSQKLGLQTLGSVWWSL